jgi:L-serine dehydratase
MKSVRNIFKIGLGPSSSHTMGPAFAAQHFKEKYPDVDFIKVILYGSLAKTGKGHGTDRAILETLAPIKNNIILDLETPTAEHPNTMDFIGYKNDEEMDSAIESVIDTFNKALKYIREE